MAELPGTGGVPRDASGAGAGEEARAGDGDAGTAADAAPVQAAAVGADATPRPRARMRERLRIGVWGNRWALLVLAPLALMGAGYAAWWFTQEPEYVPASRIGVGSDISPNPLEPTSEAYRVALEAGEEERREAAVEEGESFVPAMQSHEPMTEEPLVAQPVLPQAKAPSAQVREEVAEVVARSLPAEDASDPMVDRRYPEPRPVGTDIVRRDAPAQASGEALGMMFEDLFKVWDAPAPKMVVIRYEEPEPASESVSEPAAPSSVSSSGGDEGVVQAAATGPVVVPAGTMVYGATRVGVDSELALPVLVEVLERPFSGALLRGEFQQVRDRMLIRFHRLSDARSGLDVEVNAYAVGLDCECGAVDGEVDRHWIARVVLPAALGFAEGYLEAAAEPDETIIVDGQVIRQRSENDSKQRVAAGLAGAARRTGDVLLEGAPKRATVRLARGTELAVVFVDEVRGAEAGRG